MVFIGFATNKESKLIRFLKENNFDYNIIAESKSIAKDYEVSGYPTHVIIDKESTIVYSTTCLLYTSPSPRDATLSRMPSSA